MTSKTSEMLTCHHIGLDRQPHYAHEGVTAELAFPSFEPAQL
jgi:hypothetical protein